MATEVYQDRCFNPFGILNHLKTKSLRRISSTSQQKWNLKSTLKVCSSCRKKLLHTAPTVMTAFNEYIDGITLSGTISDEDVNNIEDSNCRNDNDSSSECDIDTMSETIRHVSTEFHESDNGEPTTPSAVSGNSKVIW